MLKCELVEEICANDRGFYVPVQELLISSNGSSAFQLVISPSSSESKPASQSDEGGDVLGVEEDCVGTQVVGDQVPGGSTGGGVGGGLLSVCLVVGFVPGES